MYRRFLEPVGYIIVKRSTDGPRFGLPDCVNRYVQSLGFLDGCLGNHALVLRSPVSYLPHVYFSFFMSCTIL